MNSSSTKMPIGVIGAGTMGRGIAQVAAMAGHPVFLFDIENKVLSSARDALEKIHQRLVEKGRLESAQAQKVLGNITYSNSLDELSHCGFIVEAVVEILEAKNEVFRSLEERVAGTTILATNTSSLSISSVASPCKHPERVIGTHFFNPAPLMALVEIIPGIVTGKNITDQVCSLIQGWGKTTVAAKDTPGFIVNRVARPFYGEALRILDEGIAGAATIDWAIREIGGFRMGPFELMDLIGNDINLQVTETVFEAFFFDPRFRPSITQKRMVEAGFLGRKSGRGYYDYRQDAANAEPVREEVLGEAIFQRILVMLINEAIDAVFMQIGSIADVDLAMTKGVNYPKGLLKWADELGLEMVLNALVNLQDEYGEDRYRPNPLLKRMVREKRSFYD